MNKDMSRWHEDWNIKVPRNFSLARLLNLKYDSGEQSELREIATVGIYEGEPTVFPMVAAGDLQAIKWALESKEDLSAFEQPERLSFMEMQVRGLFFRPRFRRWLAKLSTLAESWNHYIKRNDLANHQSGFNSSYFGSNLLFFSASQGSVSVFNFVLNSVLDRAMKRIFQGLSQSPNFSVFIGIDPDQQLEGNIVDNIVVGGSDTASSLRETVRDRLTRALLDLKDYYGNTVLHLAVLNDKHAIYDFIVGLGADQGSRNLDGMNPFTLAARLGRWHMFEHIWKTHLSSQVWRFGNVEQTKINMQDFDFVGLRHFNSRDELRWCMLGLIRAFAEIHVLQRVDFDPLDWLLQDKQDAQKIKQFIKKSVSDGDRMSLFLAGKLEYLMENQSLGRMQRFVAEVINASIAFKPHPVPPLFFLSRFLSWLRNCNTKNAPTTQINKKKAGIDARGDGWLGFLTHHRLENQICQFRYDSSHSATAVHGMTLFRPIGWDTHSEEMKRILEAKWSSVYVYVHLGNTLFPYISVMLLFCLMWWQRRLHVLEHNFWWAQPTNAGGPRTVAANLTQLLIETAPGGKASDSAFLKTMPSLPLGPETWCGLRAITDSHSGRLQLVLLIYGVPSLLLLANQHRRILATDLDCNQDMRISFVEIADFVYFNMEFLLFTIISGLLVTIFVARMAAETSASIVTECSMWYTELEQQTTAITALLIFINLFIVLKPWRSVGIFVLTVNAFFLGDIIQFLFMYALFFTGFLLALQTLHNGNHLFLAWLESAQDIVERVRLATQGQAYLANNNPPSEFESLYLSRMGISDCDMLERSVTDTAFTLLEISIGDGLSDAIGQARGSPYQCAGFTPNVLVAVLLVFWVFLTNILMLNLLIAMMNSTFDSQKTEIDSKFLVDVSSRIMRYEEYFPFLAFEYHTSKNKRPWYWTILLAIRSIPLVHFIRHLVNYLRLQCRIHHIFHEDKGLIMSKVSDILRSAFPNDEYNPYTTAYHLCLGIWRPDMLGKLQMLALRKRDASEILLKKEKSLKLNAQMSLLACMMESLHQTLAIAEQACHRFPVHLTEPPTEKKDAPAAGSESLVTWTQASSTTRA